MTSDDTSKVRFDITNSGGTNFPAQRDAIREAGASFDPTSHTWYIWHNADHLSPALAKTINDLFALAAQYGTRVRMEIDPHLSGDSPNHS